MWPCSIHFLATTARRVVVAIVPFALIVCGTSSMAESVEGNDFDCLMEPKTRVMVGSATQGVIQSVRVKRGDTVEKGQILATLDARLERAELKYAKLRSEMDGEIRAREADVRLAEVTLQRIRDLHKKSLAPAQQKDEAEAALDVARMSLQQARDNRALYEQEHARVRELVDQHIIRSPISGVVVDQMAYPGEFIFENPLLVVAQIDPLKVEAILPARYFGQIKSGMPSTVLPEIGADSFSATIASVDQVIDSASGTFLVHLDLPNPDNAVPGGQRCRLAFGEVDRDVLADRRSASR